MHLHPEQLDIAIHRLEVALQVGVDIRLGAEAETPDVAIAGRPGVPPGLRRVATELAPRGKADGRVVLLLHFLERHAHVDDVVGVVEHRAKRGPAARGGTNGGVADQVAREEQVLVLSEARRRQPEVHAGRVLRPRAI